MACALRGLACAALLTLAACAGVEPQPAMYTDVGAHGVKLDEAEATRIINSYREGRGLVPLALDPALVAAARSHSDDMAGKDKVGHKVSNGPLAERLKVAGLNPAVAGENVGAGYRTIAQAFSGWRGSPDHDRTMLLEGARRMGIAAAYAPRSKYRVFWTLIVAGEEKPQ